MDETREGNTEELHGEFSIGLLSAKATLEGPFARSKSGFLISARRTFLDPWIKQATKFHNDLNDTEGYSTYYFYDVNAKAHFQLGEKSKIFFSYYQGSDKFENTNLAEDTEVDINVIDLLGRKIISKLADVVKGQNNFELDVAHLSTGIYLLQVVTGLGKYRVRKEFIK